MMHILASFYIFYEYCYSRQLYLHIETPLIYLWCLSENCPAMKHHQEPGPHPEVWGRIARQHEDWQGTITTSNLCKPQISEN